MKTIFICLVHIIGTNLAYQQQMGFPHVWDFQIMKVWYYIYNLIVNSTQVQFEYQFIKCNISNFFNEGIPISLIGYYTSTNNKQNSIEKKKAKKCCCTVWVSVSWF